MDYLWLSPPSGSACRDPARHLAGGPAAGPAPRRRDARGARLAGRVGLVVSHTPLLVQLLFWYLPAWNLLPLAVKEVVNDEHAWSILPGNVWWLTPEFLCPMWGLGVFTSAFLVEEIAFRTARRQPRAAGSRAVAGLCRRSRSCALSSCRRGWPTPGSRVSASIITDETLIAGQRHRLCGTDLSGAAD